MDGIIRRGIRTFDRLRTKNYGCAITMPMPKEYPGFGIPRQPWMIRARQFSGLMRIGEDPQTGRLAAN